MILIENAQRWAGEGEERDLSIDILALWLTGKVQAVFVELFIGTGSSSPNHISVLTLAFKLSCNSAGLTRTPALCRNSSWHRSFPRGVCFRILRLSPSSACSHCQKVCLFVLCDQRCFQCQATWEKTVNMVCIQQFAFFDDEFLTHCSPGAYWFNEPTWHFIFNLFNTQCKKQPAKLCICSP